MLQVKWGLGRLNIDWKSVFYFAILPAVVAGLFSVAPKLYDIAVEPNAELRYSLINGPEIQVENGFQKIVSITVQNTGKRPLTNLSGTLAIANGKFESYRVQEKSGMNPILSAGNSQITLSVKKVFPQEVFSISVLLLNTIPETMPIFTLRSEEALGQIKVNNLESGSNFTFLGGILSGLSVFAMSIAIALRFKGGGGRGFSKFKQDAIFYIPARLGLTEIINELQLKNFGLTYLRMADVILSQGLQAKDDARKKCLIALKLMILIKNIAPISQSVIIKNIQILAGEPITDDDLLELKAEAVDTGDILVFREKVDQFMSKYLNSN